MYQSVNILYYKYYKYISMAAATWPSPKNLYNNALMTICAKFHWNSSLSTEILCCKKFSWSRSDLENLFSNGHSFTQWPLAPRFNESLHDIQRLRRVEQALMDNGRTDGWMDGQTHDLKARCSLPNIVCGGIKIIGSCNSDNAVYNDVITKF